MARAHRERSWRSAGRHKKDNRVLDIMCKLRVEHPAAAFKSSRRSLEDQCPVTTPRKAEVPNPKRASPGLGSMHRRSRIELNAIISR